jgi:predicted Zn-dependent peptidase
MKKLSIFIVTLLYICLAQAQNKYVFKTAQAAGYTYRYVTNDPTKARFYTLKNGLMVILSENHKTPLISTLMPVRAGSNTDPRTNTGLAHYLEHMLFKGTDKYGSLDWAKEKPLLDKIDALYETYNKTTDSAPRKTIYAEIDKTSNEASKYSIANEYDKMMASMGAQGSNAFTSTEQTVYTEDIPANAIDRFIAIQAERFRNPILRIFHTELEAVYEEKNRSLDSDPNKVDEALNAALYPTHNYGQQTTIGTIEHLKNPSLVEIRKYYNQYYVPNNMAIIMVGDFNADALIKKLDNAFSYMQTKPITPYIGAVEQPLSAPIIKEVYGPTPESLRMAWRWPAATSKKEKLVGSIIDALLNNSKAGILDINLVQAQKLLRANTYTDWQKDYSSFNIIATPKTGQTLEEVKNLLLEQIEKLKSGNFDESIIKAIAYNNKLAQLKGIESNESRAYALLDNFIIERSEGWHNACSFIEDMTGVTKQDITQFSKKYCDNNYVCIYKKQGEDKTIVKVDKPQITPVETNRDKESDFLKKVNNMNMQPIKPKFIDFAKDVVKKPIDKTTLLYVKNKDHDIFKLQYVFNMGAWHSKILPVAIAYLNFLGTNNLSNEQINTSFYKLASSYSISTSDKFTYVTLTGLQENFNSSLALLENVFTSCKADEQALAQLKERILKQRTDIKKNKNAILQALTSYAIYGAENPTNSLILTNAEIQNIKATDLIEVIRSMFNYKYTITYYGPKTITDITTQINAQHKQPRIFKSNPALIKNFVKQTPQKNQVFFTNYDMVQAEINFVRPTENYQVKNTPIIELYNNYFGGGMGSLVFQTIRESKALAYSTYAVYSTPSSIEDKYTMVGYVGTQADKMNDAITAMNDLWNNLPDVPQNVLIAKDGIKKTLQTESVPNESIIDNYLAAQNKGLQVDVNAMVYNEIDKLTIKDLQAFATKNFSNKPLSYCVVANDKKINTDNLKKYGSVQTLSLEELFGY